MLLKLPFRLVNGLNTREHWTVKARRAREQRNVTRMALTSQRAWRPETYALPCVVTLTRVAPRPFDGHDGLPSAFKHVVDGIVDSMGLDTDSVPGLTFVYEWLRGKPKEHYVVLEIKSLAADVTAPAPGDPKASPGTLKAPRTRPTAQDDRNTLGSFRTS